LKSSPAVPVGQGLGVGVEQLAGGEGAVIVSVSFRLHLPFWRSKRVIWPENSPPRAPPLLWSRLKMMKASSMPAHM